MITAVSADGTDARAFDEGQGPVILVIHPGLDDGRSWKKVAARLARRFRVVRIVRRHYRVDLPTPPGPRSDQRQPLTCAPLAKARH
jgi:pimeloyl-ACP methyl ester carboxylesterase